MDNDAHRGSRSLGAPSASSAFCRFFLGRAELALDAPKVIKADSEAVEKATARIANAKNDHDSDT
ncbi:MAG: hypothetical protein U9Q79_08870 [Candidatus Hydrogenedentes bacterium]|nr:hypothetical protein [Candidatus Hydrogenedentota bacterium]